MGKPWARFYNLIQLVTSVKSILPKIVLCSSYNTRFDPSAARLQNRPFEKGGMMKTKRIVIAVIVFVTLALVLAACGHSRFAGYHGVTPEKRVEWVKKYIAGELKLDEAQNAKLDAIAADLMDRRKKMAPEREKGRLELAELVRSEKLDRVDLERLVDKKRAHIEDVIDVGLDHAVEFHQMLTPEQRTLLAEKIEKHERGRCWK
jgi:protein CpxP